MTVNVQVCPVYRDPRGKNDEHCFAVIRGAIIEHHRAPSREAAEELREQFVKGVSA